MNGHTDPQQPVPVRTDFDVLIIGAGISGINAAYRLQASMPHLSYAILEAREAMGGTWNLFKYPGIRSDSDLFTFGFSWNPWDQPEPIAEGPAITKYINETAEKFGIDKHILFRHKMVSADWSNSSRTWTLQVQNGDTSKNFTASFVVLGTGYYDYDKPLDAHIPGLENFNGTVIHPQFWPEDLDYSNKKMVIVGSGATAITLLPSLAEKAASVTMLQRSPSYVLALPNAGSPTRLLSWIMPNNWLLRLNRFLWILRTQFFVRFCRRYPNFSRWALARRASRLLPPHISIDPHFNPTYKPWEQRMGICPDGDFYRALRNGNADIVTDTIKTVSSDGIELTSGKHLDADIIVTATGLRLQIAGGATLGVDGKALDMSTKFMWRGVMLQDVPNMAVVLGYPNASWTLGADITARFIVRMLQYLRSKNAQAIVPRVTEEQRKTFKPTPLLDLNSTYIKRASERLPKGADQGPWRGRNDYIADEWGWKRWSLEEGIELIGEGEKKNV